MLEVKINSLGSTWGIAMKILKSVKLLTIKVKVESYTSSATKDFNHTMATMLAAHYVFNFWYNVFYARVFVRDR